MGMKQGGSSSGWLKGMKGNYSCSICGRRYGVLYMKERHEKKCREYNE